MVKDRAAERQHQKAVADRAKTVLQTGLSVRPDTVDIQALARKLGEVERTPAAMAARLHDVFETSARVGAPTGRLACKKGCAFCCHLNVSVTEIEAFALAAAVRKGGPEAVDAFRKRAASTAGLTVSQRVGAKLPCPLLIDGACSVYRDRPLSCRAVVSFDVEPCRDEFEGQAGEIDIPGHYTAHARNALAALGVAMAESGRPIRQFELSVAVLHLIDKPNAEAHWRQGADAFEGVPTLEGADA